MPRNHLAVRRKRSLWRPAASMRPRRVPRNHTAIALLAASGRPASMRPRRVPRNHLRPRAPCREGKVASMRPRRVPRNHAERHRFREQGMSGFNEAEARASESPFSLAYPCARPRGFNEAEARASESRLPSWSRVHSRWRFNEAEARASESPCLASGHAFPLRASMRPRRVPRNHTAWRELSRSIETASMRPRRVPRNHAFGSTGSGRSGAGFNEAEARASESRGSGRAAFRSPKRRFNEAEARASESRSAGRRRRRSTVLLQ